MMQVAWACSAFSLLCADKRHCSTTRPPTPPPTHWTKTFRGHSALLPTHRWVDEKDRRCGYFVKQRYVWNWICFPTVYAAQRMTRPRLALVPESTPKRSYSPFNWCCLRLISASIQLALRQVFSCSKCPPGPGPDSRSMLKSNWLQGSTTGHITLCSRALQ